MQLREVERWVAHDKAAVAQEARRETLGADEHGETHDERKVRQEVAARQQTQHVRHMRRPGET